jgi:hypothetical protein
MKKPAARRKVSLPDSSVFNIIIIRLFSARCKLCTKVNIRIFITAVILLGKWLILVLWYHSFFP